MSTENKNQCVVINAEFLFEFDSFERWVNKASSWFKGKTKYDVIVCLDRNGFVCHIGEDFMKARDEKSFPVKCFRLKRTIEDKL